MKRSDKIGLGIIGVVVLICGTGLFCIYFLPIFKTFEIWRQQMLAGQQYMNSLSEKDFQVWADRTQNYLSNFNPTNWLIEEGAIPWDLRELKIVGIYESSNSVDYVWMGGMDHTLLRVEQLTNGQFQFTAIYSDASNRVIWPREMAGKDSQTP